MAAFNELIKNYDKIRDYMREFLIHGYKSRSDFNKRSSRTYDNERRRIENYLSSYIHYENTAKGKSLYISSNAIDLEANPLFASWQSKSFTKNDIMLHFILFDILLEGSRHSANEITEIIADDYLSAFDTPRLPDAMTVRNKLKEYVGLGLIEEFKEGRQAFFCIKRHCVPLDEANIGHDLAQAIRYYQNVLPAGILGYVMSEQDGDGYDGGIFSFRQQFFAQVLDEDIMLQLLEAIREQHSIHITLVTKLPRVRQNKVTMIPLAVVNNIYTGRRYIAVYNTRGKVYETYRIDRIIQVTKLQPAVDYAKHKQMICYHLSKAWGVSINKEKPLERIGMDIRIFKGEGFVLDRIRREGRHGVLTEIGEGLFRYEIEVSDAWEAIPWFRTFIGRMENFHCDNRYLERYFWKDVKGLADMYGLTEVNPTLTVLAKEVK